ncbi:MAG: M1 family aminopeptidase [Bacteroidota bacterium]
MIHSRLVVVGPPLAIKILSLALLLLTGARLGTARVTAPLDDLRGAETPAQLADRVMAAFATGSAADFEAWYPFEDGRALVEVALQDGDERVRQTAHVAAVDGDTAVLLLGGLLRFGNTGDETIYAGDLSGLYEAARHQDGLWRLARRVGWEALNRPTAHRLWVDLDPGQGLHVTDTLTIDTHDRYGLLLSLNHAVELDVVELNGEPAEYVFGGGRLWMGPSSHEGPSELMVRYTVDVAQDSTTGVNSGRFEPDYGHVRNQYHWHPFADYDDAADMAITVRAPASVRVATDLEQRETVEGATRIVRARSARPAGPLSLFYDAGWVPVQRQAGAYTLTVFATPDFTPTPDTLARAFSASVDVLRERFGSPLGTYIAVVQQRARPGTGWPYLSNRVIAANTKGAVLDSPFPQPRALFGHEVAHAWTSPTGPTRNFLSEGWATYAESILLEAVYGAETEALFWVTKRNNYFAGGFEGQDRLLDDIQNAGISYDKGAWVLRMLADRIGQEAFDATIRAFASLPAEGPADYEAFKKILQETTGQDMSSFLDPWITSRHVPDLRARMEGTDLVVEQVQAGPLYELELDLDVVTRTDTLRTRVALRGRQARTPLAEVTTDPAPTLLIDPDQRLLVRQLRGDRVTLETDAPAEATVELSGDFYDRSFQQATYTGGRWRVEVPLVAGQYFYAWRIDGAWQDLETLRVAPRVELDPADAYPE